MSITHQITYCAWLVIVFRVMDFLLVDHACRSSMISWLQVTLECECKFCVISCLQVIIPCFFLLLWISYWTSRAQLCHHQLIVPCCSASMVCRSAVDSWNHWRTALLSWLQLQEGAFTHYHIFGSCSLVVSDSLACCRSYDSNAWVLLQVQVSTFSSTSRWLHD
jgi:hypothetical protein